MKDIIENSALVAKCGLYCGACTRYLKGKCPGCAENKKASWCTVRSCTQEHGYFTCADCSVSSIEDCKKYNNFMSKLFGFIFNSDRAACIRRIQTIGLEPFVTEMTQNRTPSIRKGKTTANPD